MAHYDPFDRVEGDTEYSFPSVPPLDPGLAAILLKKSTIFSSRKPMPPSSCDQVTARLTTWAHQGTAQTAAALNNILLLTSSDASIAAQPGALPTELVTKISKDMSAFLILFVAAVLVQACIKVWMTVLQRNTWFHICQLPEQISKATGQPHQPRWAPWAARPVR